MPKKESFPDSGSNPTVMIMMPLFNESEHLLSALKCLIAQTYDNWILFAQDNHSGDSTPEILAAYSKLDSRIVWRRNVQFVSATKNWHSTYEYASRNFKFQYVCFMAGDDYWSNPDFLENCICEFISNPTKSVSVPLFVLEYENEKQVLNYSIQIHGHESKERIKTYLKRWGNANLLYAVYEANYFSTKMQHHLTKFSEYRGSDWWWGLGIAIDQQACSNDGMVYVKKVSPVRIRENEIRIAISNLEDSLKFLFFHIVKEHKRLTGTPISTKFIIARFSIRSWLIQLFKAIIHLFATVKNSKK
jgi:glycosyltransferase involved in cell wall biosynthesis